MDAAEADADVKLYKASSELLSELQAKIPRLVKTGGTGKAYRKWVISSKVYEVNRLLDRFQEWPQLLDPHLSKLVQILVDAYLSYCVLHPHEYLGKRDAQVHLIPLPRAVASILYAFCKVRGRKVIVRLLNNEPKFVEPLLSCFISWTSIPDTATGEGHSTMTWEERYIHLLWLSHLMLAPFELSTISGLSVDPTLTNITPELYDALPQVAISLNIVGMNHLQLPSKDREAASILLVRLCLRSDMQKLGLLGSLLAWAVEELQQPVDQPNSTGYHYIGILELVFGIMHSASDSEAAPFLSRVFQMSYTAATSEEEMFRIMRDSAAARKLLVKIMRAAVVHALSMSTLPSSSVISLDLNDMLENCIQTLLEFLADKDTPVRQAASKALSLICLKMDASMSSEVAEAVLDTLNENMLLEDIKTGKLFPYTDTTKSAANTYKKNLNAVDPLRWHGCMLTLGHLLFRRSLPPSQLPAVVEALIMGLDFEQRSNVGTSVGVGVRDAACFGIWSLARKYSTAELNRVTFATTLLPGPTSFSNTGEVSTLQLIATHLSISACTDPSGNLRRGSAAALQELIGRHPDVIAEGISVVQTIDYHAVARRSRALTDVAVAASKLSGHYHSALLYALLAWRGAKSSDADSRRQAAQATGSLVALASDMDAVDLINELIAQINNLKASNSGSNAAARHGLLCCLAAILVALEKEKSTNTAEIFKIMRPVLEDLPSILGTIQGRITADIENVLEATSRVILAGASFISRLSKSEDHPIPSDYPAQWTSHVISILERCTISSDKTFLTDIAAEANVAVIGLLERHAQTSLLSCWLDPKQQTRTDFICRGRIATFGQVFPLLQSISGLDTLESQILRYVVGIVDGSYHIETKVSAMQSIDFILMKCADLNVEVLTLLNHAIHAGLQDYTIDRRGDIGSLLRLEALKAVEQLRFHKSSADEKQKTLQLLARLAAEKMVKVRFQAWKRLEEWLDDEDVVMRTFDHQADISSPEYFGNLLDLLFPQSQYQEQLLLGFVSSAAGGTEEVSRACSEALIAFMQDQKGLAKRSMANAIVHSMTVHLETITQADDREVIPVIDFLAFFVEHIVVPLSSLDSDMENDELWLACRKVHAGMSTILRLESLVRLYSSLALLGLYRIRALDRLTRMLLHKWPKIRGAAADALFLRTTTQALVKCDWNAPIADNKSTVVAIRKELNVAGIAAV